jgi:hypothetical protein
VLVLGTNIDGLGGSIPADGVIQVAFDRYLLPATITRQSYTVLDANHAPLPILGLRTIYDPIARTVTIGGPDPGQPWLTPNLTYHLVLTVPPDDDNDQSGFRAIDRAPLAAPQDFTFRAGNPLGPSASKLFEPVVDFCADVMPLFAGSCSGAGCHEQATAAMSMVLITPSGVKTTAVGRLAMGSTTAANAVGSSPPGKIFGINMAIVEPNRPDSSWLMYKVDLAAPPDEDDTPKWRCTPAPGSPTNRPSTPPFSPLAPFHQATDADRSILNDFVLGREMPYPSTGHSLTFAQRELIRLWIAQGATVDLCKGCDQVQPDAGVDAGQAVAPDAATPQDGGVDGGDGGDGG